MKLVRFDYDGRREVGLLVDSSVAPVQEINARLGTRIPNDMLEIIRTGALEALPTLAGVETIPLDRITPVLPYDVPGRSGALA